MTSLTKPVKRKSERPFQHYKKALIIELLPGDYLRLRLQGDRESKAVVTSLHTIYIQLLKQNSR